MEKLTTCVLCTVGGVARVFLGGPFRSAPWYFFNSSWVIVLFPSLVEWAIFFSQLVGTSVGEKLERHGYFLRGWTCFEGRVFCTCSSNFLKDSLWTWLEVVLWYSTGSAGVVQPFRVTQVESGTASCLTGFLAKPRPRCCLGGVGLGFGSKNPESSINVHPAKLTWNLKITCLKREIIFQNSILGFHVNFQGCIHFYRPYELLVSTGVSQCLVSSFPKGMPRP